MLTKAHEPTIRDPCPSLASGLPTLALPQMHDLKLFSGNANKALSQQIADYLGVPLGQLSLGKFTCSSRPARRSTTI